MQERAPLMVLQPVRLDRPERRAPRRDRGEPVEAPVRRPATRRARPAAGCDASRSRMSGIGQPRSADVLADREVHVVPGDPLDPPLVPELREPGVDVDERCPPKPAADRLRAHVAADVDEQVAPCGRVGAGVLEPEAFGDRARVVERPWSRVVRLLDQAHLRSRAGGSRARSSAAPRPRRRLPALLASAPATATTRHDPSSSSRRGRTSRASKSASASRRAALACVG